MILITMCSTAGKGFHAESVVFVVGCRIHSTSPSFTWVLILLALKVLSLGGAAASSSSVVAASSLSSLSSSLPSEDLPSFVSPIFNITIAAGRDAQLPCNIENLDSYKVAWLRVEDKGILTIHDHVITRNYRISLIHTDERQFTLLIKNIQPSDAGGYMCQINTVPMMSQVGFIEVVVPPQILASESSTDVIATEGSNVSLICRASGHPDPHILWKREDRSEIPLQTPQGKKYSVQNYSGDSLTILRVTRMHMGAFLCIASNGIQPSVSRRVLLKVQFPPAIWLPTQSLTAVLHDHEISMSCHIESFPSSVNHWIKDAGRPGAKSLTIDASDMSSSDKYRIEQETKDYKTHLILTIRRLERTDFGVYTCLAKNSLGMQEASLSLHEIPLHGRSSASSTSFSKKRQHKSKQKEISRPDEGGGGGSNGARRRTGGQFYNSQNPAILVNREEDDGRGDDDEEGDDGDEEQSPASRSHSGHFAEADSSSSVPSCLLLMTPSSRLILGFMIMITIHALLFYPSSCCSTNSGILFFTLSCFLLNFLPDAL